MSLNDWEQGCMRVQYFLVQEIINRFKLFPIQHFYHQFLFVQ